MNFYQLIDQGKYEEGFSRIKDLSGDDFLEAKLIESIILLVALGKPTQALSLPNKYLKKCNISRRTQCLALITRSFGYLWKANYKESWSDLDQVEELVKSLSKKEDLDTRIIYSFLYLLRGDNFIVQGKFNMGINMFLKGIDIASKDDFPSKIVLFNIYNDLAVTYERMGEWNVSIEYHNTNLELAEKLQNDAIKVSPLIKIGTFHKIQGDLDLALDYSQKSLTLSKKWNFALGLSRSLSQLGTVYHHKGDFNSAIEFYKSALTSAQKIQVDAFSDVSSILYNICLLYLDTKKIDDTKFYLKQLKSHRSKDRSLTTEVYCLLIEALILKESTRFRDKAQAQDLLRKIIESDKTTNQFKVLAKLHLCELILQEIKLNENETLLNEVKILIGEVKEIAYKWKFIPDLISTLIIQAKLKLIEGNASRSSQLLEEAHEIAKFSVRI
jgi:tetratricopeptide (TPR) repeat protein